MSAVPGSVSGPVRLRLYLQLAQGPLVAPNPMSGSELPEFSQVSPSTIVQRND